MKKQLIVREMSDQASAVVYCHYVQNTLALIGVISNLSIKNGEIVIMQIVYTIHAWLILLRQTASYPTNTDRYFYYLFPIHQYSGDVRSY